MHVVFDTLARDGAQLLVKYPPVMVAGPAVLSMAPPEPPPFPAVKT